MTRKKITNFQIPEICTGYSEAEICALNSMSSPTVIDHYLGLLEPVAGKRVKKSIPRHSNKSTNTENNRLSRNSYE